MRKMVFLMICCSIICVSAYIFGGAKLENARDDAIERMYIETVELMVPYIEIDKTEHTAFVYKDMEQLFFPILANFRATEYEARVTEDEWVGQDELEDESTPQDMSENTTETGEDSPQDSSQTEEQASETASAQTAAGVVTATEKKVEINRTKLQDFDYLSQNFYQVDNTTTIGSNQLDVNKLLGKDMTIAQEADGPQILIYHTHSQEGYADSVAGDASTSIVAVGDYLTELLETNYGIDVLHHKGEYDVVKRDGAYSNALPDLQQILEENPSIEVVIDLHRDAVPETTHLVTEVNGKQTAQIMFFNGLSRTTSRGDLEYLANPNIEYNLAFSFQMQLTAAEYYPGLTRKIYLKGYRYNMHLRPKSLLIEVGAQNNTLQEAKNAMEPLADILAKVLYNGVK